MNTNDKTKGLIHDTKYTWKKKILKFPKCQGWTWTTVEKELVKAVLDRCDSAELGFLPALGQFESDRFLLPSVLWPAQGRTDTRSRTVSAGRAREAPCLWDDVDRLFESKASPPPYTGERFWGTVLLSMLHLCICFLSEKQVWEFLIKDLRVLCMSRSILQALGIIKWGGWLAQ